MDQSNEKTLLAEITERTEATLSDCMFKVESLEMGVVLWAYTQAHPAARFSQKAQSTVVDFIRSDLIHLIGPEPKLISTESQSHNGDRFMGQGNKIFKLLPNWLWMKAKAYRGIVSFGGPWSNHLHALACIGKQLKFETRGIVRGERRACLTPTLSDAEHMQMNLSFVPRNVYRALATGNNKGKSALSTVIGEEAHSLHSVPAGASNALSVVGTTAYGDKISKVSSAYDELWLPVGTGGSLLGIANGIYARKSPAFRKIFGVNVLANPGLEDEQRKLYSNCEELGIPMQGLAKFQDRVAVLDGAQGGYGAVSGAYQRFYGALTKRLAIPLDHVYMGKVLYSLSKALERDTCSGRVAVLHTGGVQGRRGYGYRFSQVAPMVAAS